MTNAIIDNSAIDYGKVVLWQYDKAINLIRLLAMMRELYNASVSGFWEFWCASVLSIDNCDDFGADMWALFIGVVRPKVTIGGQTRSISLDLYRRYLKASFYLMNSDCSLPALNEFYRILFPYQNSQKVHIEDNFNMSIEFKVIEAAMTPEELAFFNQNKADLTPHPLGILTNQPVEEFVFGFDGQEDEYEDYKAGVPYEIGTIVKYDDGESGYIKWKCLLSVSAAYNSSWDAVKSIFAPTIDGDPIVAGLCEDPTILSYEIGVPYGAGSIVEKSGVAYWCKTDVLATENTSWESISASFRFLLFQPRTEYGEGEIVVAEGRLMFLCKELVTVEDNEGWESVRDRFSKCFSNTTFICSTTERFVKKMAY